MIKLLTDEQLSFQIMHCQVRYIFTGVHESSTPNLRVYSTVLKYKRVIILCMYMMMYVYNANGQPFHSHLIMMITLSGSRVTTKKPV